MTKIYGLCEKCNKRFAYLCADCVMRETAATRAELAAEYEQLDKANEAAPSWGAAVGARHERMTAIVRTLVGLDLKERQATHHTLGEAMLAASDRNEPWYKPSPNDAIKGVLDRESAKWDALNDPNSTLTARDLNRTWERDKPEPEPTSFDALTVIHAFQAEGWNDHTLVLLLADFINAEKLSGPLNAYLNRLWNETVDIKARDLLARRRASDE